MFSESNRFDGAIRNTAKWNREWTIQGVGLKNLNYLYRYYAQNSNEITTALPMFLGSTYPCSKTIYWHWCTTKPEEAASGNYKIAASKLDLYLYLILYYTRNEIAMLIPMFSRSSYIQRDYSGNDGRPKKTEEDRKKTEVINPKCSPLNKSWTIIIFSVLIHKITT